MTCLVDRTFEFFSIELKTKGQWEACMRDLSTRRIREKKSLGQLMSNVEAFWCGLTEMGLLCLFGMLNIFIW